MDILDDPRYKDRPVFIFFEKYVMDVIGELGEDKQKVLDEINLQQIFGTQSTAWRDVIEEVLRLSPTIVIAILDEWYKNIDSKREQGQEPDPQAFTLQFVDSYFEEGSQIDVWPDQQALEEAKERITNAQAQLEEA